MIYQTMPRKGYGCCTYSDDKGFFIEGRNYKNCMEQLRDYCNEHPEKWVYYFDTGFGVSSYSSIGRYILEVMIYDKKPAGLVISKLYQAGCENMQDYSDIIADIVSNYKVDKEWIEKEISRSPDRRSLNRLLIKYDIPYIDIN